MPRHRNRKNDLWRMLAIGRDSRDFRENPNRSAFDLPRLIPGHFAPIQGSFSPTPVHFGHAAPPALSRNQKSEVWRILASDWNSRDSRENPNRLAFHPARLIPGHFAPIRGHFGGSLAFQPRRSAASLSQPKERHLEVPGDRLEF